MDEYLHDQGPISCMLPLFEPGKSRDSDIEMDSDLGHAQSTEFNSVSRKNMDQDEYDRSNTTQIPVSSLGYENSAAGKIALVFHTLAVRMTQ